MTAERSLGPDRAQREAEAPALPAAANRAPTRMAAQATTPTTQLQSAPIEPAGPPPISWKVGSIGATVRPMVTHQAAPRQTR